MYGPIAFVKREREQDLRWICAFSVIRGNLKRPNAQDSVFRPSVHLQRFLGQSLGASPKNRSRYIGWAGAAKRESGSWLELQVGSGEATSIGAV